MPIQVSKFKEVPAVEYKYLHMLECSIRLATADDAKTEIKAIFLPYGYDANGNKVFAPTGEITLFHDDFLTLAYQDYRSGDPTYMQAFYAMEAALTKILGDQLPDLVGSPIQITDL